MKTVSKIKSLVAATSIACGVMVSPAVSAAPVWDAFGVLGGTTTVAAGTVTFTAPGTSPTHFWVDTFNGNTPNGQSGMKAYYGTDAFDGQSLSVLGNYTLTYGPGNPYVNIYVTNGAGKTAILLPIALNSVDFDQVVYQVFESSDTTFLANDNVGTTTWATLVGLGLLINTNGVFDNQFAPDDGWAAEGAFADGITLGWGNRGGNNPLYAAPAILTSDPTFVPEPGSLALLGLGLAGLAMRRRKVVA